MSILKYFARKDSSDTFRLPDVTVSASTTLSSKDIRSANESVKPLVKQLEDKKPARKVSTREKYNGYSPEQRAQIGKYAAENGATRASRHFSTRWNMDIPESSVRRMKSEYLSKVREVRARGEESDVPSVTSLPTKPQGRPLMLGKVIDTAVQDYVTAMRAVGGVVNTNICMAAAEGIVASRDQGLLAQHGGHIQITNAWARSLLTRMGYVKRKCSNAGKVAVPRFLEIQGDFLADIQAEVVMNEIPAEFVLNWDQTALHLVPTGQWTMHKSGEKVVPITNSDDKRQITAVLAVTMSGEYLPPQLIYKGKTERCHPAGEVPDGWDIWHSHNHWSNEETMLRYVEKVIVPFVDDKRATLQLDKAHPALAIFDCFRGQTTPEFAAALKKHNIIQVPVPANCTDKLQPLDISINKPMKDELRRRFQTWYADEVSKQLRTVSIHEVRVDTSAAVIKSKSLGWFVSAWQSLSSRPTLAINGFKKAGIYDALTEVTEE